MLMWIKLLLVSCGLRQGRLKTLQLPGDAVSHRPRKRARTDDFDECVITALEKIADNAWLKGWK
jgi:hypothetical protein